jgi:ribosomal protein S18 acetylase RimI-like enzyme
VQDDALPQALALLQDKVVGFCDIIPNAAKGFGHVGRLGMGVRFDNVAALALYHSFGFVQEGLKTRGRKLENRYQDVALMALWL